MFRLISKFEATGDQPEAIQKLAKGLKAGEKHQVLLGVTGSGKTFSVAKVIEQYGKPTLVISHNKTLAAQLYRELKVLFPKNAVHYFVSYYDYYQPEAYIPHTDTYIEKDSKINQEIDRLRHAATQALMNRDDVIIVASVSCIYNLGSPEDYKNLGLNIFEKKKIKPTELVRELLRLQYAQDIELKRGCFRKTTNEIEIMSASGQEAVKVTFKGDAIEKILRAAIANPDDLELAKPDYERVLDTTVFPAKYWITSDDKLGVAIQNIQGELQKHLVKLRKQKKSLEAARLQEKTKYDTEMMRRTGYCHGIENYSMHLDFRKPGEPPYTLLDFFASKGEFLTIIDESHMTVPQLRSMHRGDFSRKSTLVNYGFRLPSAVENHPLKFEEFTAKVQKTIYASATPAKYELAKAGKKNIAEQLVRPTGLLDPTIEIRKSENQIEHLLEQIAERTKHKERVIITTLTKRMAEDLTEHLAGQGISVNYIHSEVKTLDRLKILRDFRKGVYDVMVGVNLLREGLDLPEVSLVAILDADKEGFLRNTTTLIQTMGRAARHVNGHVIMYADRDTRSITAAVGETQRRRKKQETYNKKFGIIPTSIQKEISDYDLPITPGRESRETFREDEESGIVFFGNTRKREVLKQLTKLMEKATRNFDYERALLYRDQIRKLKQE